MNKFENLNEISSSMKSNKMLGILNGDTHQFKEIFDKYIEDVNNSQHYADEQIKKLAAGEINNPHEVMIALDEAKKSLELMLEIKNKLTSALEQLQRT